MSPRRPRRRSTTTWTVGGTERRGGVVKVAEVRTPKSCTNRFRTTVGWRRCVGGRRRERLAAAARGEHMASPHPMRLNDLRGLLRHNYLRIEPLLAPPPTASELTARRPGRRELKAKETLGPFAALEQEEARTSARVKRASAAMRRAETARVTAAEALSVLEQAQAGAKKKKKGAEEEEAALSAALAQAEEQMAACEPELADARGKYELATSALQRARAVEARRAMRREQAHLEARLAVKHWQIVGRVLPVRVPRAELLADAAGSSGGNAWTATQEATVGAITRAMRSLECPVEPRLVGRLLHERIGRDGALVTVAALRDYCEPPARPAAPCATTAPARPLSASAARLNAPPQPARRPASAAAPGSRAR